MATQVLRLVQQGPHRHASVISCRRSVQLLLLDAERPTRTDPQSAYCSDLLEHVDLSPPAGNRVLRCPARGADRNVRSVYLPLTPDVRRLNHAAANGTAGTAEFDRGVQSVYSKGRKTYHAGRRRVRAAKDTLGVA